MGCVLPLVQGDAPVTRDESSRGLGGVRGLDELDLGDLVSYFQGLGGGQGRNQRVDVVFLQRPCCGLHVCVVDLDDGHVELVGKGRVGLGNVEMKRKCLLGQNLGVQTFRLKMITS